MSEPLDLEPIRERDAKTDTDHDGFLSGYIGYPVMDRHVLLAEVDRLRDEISDRANIEADLRAQIAAIAELHTKDDYGDCDDCGWAWPCPSLLRLGGPP